MNAGRIATVKEVADLIGIDGAGENARLVTLIEAGSAWLETFTNRTFKEQTGVQDFYDSRGGRFLWLRRRPITTTTPLEISVDPGQDFDNTSNHLTEEAPNVSGDFVIDRDLGKVSLVGNGSFLRGPKAIRVTYSAGYADDEIPGLAKKALAYYVAFFLKKFELRSGIIESSRTIQQGSTSIVQGIPAEVRELARPLRLPPVAAGTGGFF